MGTVLPGPSAWRCSILHCCRPVAGSVQLVYEDGTDAGKKFFCADHLRRIDTPPRPESTMGRRDEIDRDVHEHEGAWHFWDETGTTRHGPYPTRDAALEGYGEYGRLLNGEVTPGTRAETTEAPDGPVGAAPGPTPPPGDVPPALQDAPLLLEIEEEALLDITGWPVVTTQLGTDDDPVHVADSDGYVVPIMTTPLLDESGQMPTTMGTLQTLLAARLASDPGVRGPATADADHLAHLFLRPIVRQPDGRLYAPAQVIIAPRGLALRRPGLDDVPLGSR